MNLAIAILTGVLVAVTGYYAWQTQQTVKVMREQQKALLRPVLTIRIDQGYWTVVNVGLGPALNVRYVSEDSGGVIGRAEPLGPGQAYGLKTVRVGSGAHMQFAYEDLRGNAYWSRYCPKAKRWQLGEGLASQGDFGCRCQVECIERLPNPL